MLPLGLELRRLALRPGAVPAGVVLLGLLCALAVVALGATQHDRHRPAPAAAQAQVRGVEIAQHGGYPELRVNGQPFFPNSAAFFYSRIPRYLWETSLEEYHALGINTIDLYIIWNWHEPREGELDFDGHTNPRRDLRGLLALIARKGFKLIARPGPTILNEWRNGGYPDWLLAQAPYGMPLADRIEGRYPPPAGRNARDAEGAARMWMENPVHMAHAHQWLQAVARELAPYRATEKLSFPLGDAKKQKDLKESAEIDGPLLFLQIEDDLAIGRANSPGPEFWKYVETLCGVLHESGAEAPCFINPTAPRAAAAGALQQTPIYTMGQWYLPPEGGAGLEERKLIPADLNTLQLEAALLATQPAFPPALIEYNASWYAPGEDDRPQPGPAANTLLSAGLLLGAGIRGLNWFPLQDTLTPAGFAIPWANRNYRWDSPLSLSGSHRGRYPAAQRIGQQLLAWGKLLAASHRRADFAAVDPLPALPPEKLARNSADDIATTTERLLRLADYAGLSADLVDPHHQPPEQLLRYPMILFPVPPGGAQEPELSEVAQQTLAAYVRAGGILVCFPRLPGGPAFQAIAKTMTAPADALPPGTTVWSEGTGRLVVLSKDFYSWISVKDDFSSGRERFEAAYAISLLSGLLDYAGLRPVVRRTEEGLPSSDFLASELVANEGTLPLGERTGGQGWLSVSNLNYEVPLSEMLEVLSPRASARAQKRREDDLLTIPVNLPPAESLLLPIETPLCGEGVAGRRCEDRVISAGAELVRAERDGRSLVLTFCAPARASVRLHLGGRPGHAELDDNPVSARWTAEDKELSLELLRGPSPGFLRVLRIPMPYEPLLPERPQQNRRSSPANLHISARGAVRMPLGPDSSLLTDPPLFVVEQGEDASLRLGVENKGEIGGEAQVRITGIFDAFAHTYVPGGMLGALALPLRASAVDAAAARSPNGDGLFPGTLRFGPASAFEDSPVSFAILPAKRTVGYTFDFDADGQPERVLENAALRAIVSPASGGRLIALVDKASDFNLTSTSGLFQDSFAFTPNPEGVRPERGRGRYGLFNRLYPADWVPGDSGPALRLAYDAPDVYPHGARIEKILRLTGERAGSMEYHVALLMANAQRRKEESEGNIFAGPAPPGTSQRFVILGSLPASSADALGTQFCWTSAQDNSSSALAPNEHCEEFRPGGTPILLPAGAVRLEVRTPHHPRLTLDWAGAGPGTQLVLEPKRYSALFRLSCAALEPGGAHGLYRIEFSVKDPP